MTTIVWDGKTLAVDAMTTQQINGKESLTFSSIKLRRLVAPIPVGPKPWEDYQVSIVTGAGKTELIHRWTSLLNGRTTTGGNLIGLCRQAARLGISGAQLIFVGRNTKTNEPACFTLVRGILTPVNKTKVVGNASGVLHVLVREGKSDLTAAELVYCGIRLDPESSGFHVESYDPETDLIERIDTWAEDRVKSIHDRVTAAYVELIKPIGLPAIPGFLHLTEGDTENAEWFKPGSDNQ